MLHMHASSTDSSIDADNDNKEFVVFKFRMDVFNFLFIYLKTRYGLKLVACGVV